jgi:hypothetical protein
VPAPWFSELDGEKMRGVPESYYAARSRRDPAWRQEQIASATQRGRGRRAADPGGYRAARREDSRRCRERQRERGLTFGELLERSPGDAQTLRRILREEVGLGRITWLASSRRFALDGKLDAETTKALTTH